MYSCHLFLISSASVRSIPFLSFIEAIFAWNVPSYCIIMHRGWYFSREPHVIPWGDPDLSSWRQIIDMEVQFSSITQLCPTLCDPMDCRTPGLPVHHQLLEPAQTHVHWVRDAIQPFHPLSSPSPSTFNLSQHQSLFQWVNSSNQVSKVLEFQLQHLNQAFPTTKSGLY